MGKKPSTKKSTSQNRCKGKGLVPTLVARNTAAKGNNNRSVVTSQRGSSSTASQSNPADHPLFGVRRYTHKNHNSSDPVLHVNVTNHLSYKNNLTHIKGCGNNTLCGLKFQASEIKIPSWSVSVVGWGDADDCEVLDIPRGKSSTCLPLPEDVKYVSASTATQLLDMISGLNSLLFTKCMAARTIISELRQGTHTQHKQNPLATKEIADAEDDCGFEYKDDEDNDNGFETSSEDGEEDEEDEENVEDEEDEEHVEDEEVEENRDEDENDQEDEEDEVLVEETTTKSPPPNTKRKGVVTIKGKGKASPKKRKTSLLEQDPEPHPISKRLRPRKKT